MRGKCSESWEACTLIKVNFLSLVVFIGCEDNPAEMKNASNLSKWESGKRGTENQQSREESNTFTHGDY